MRLIPVLKFYGTCLFGFLAINQYCYAQNAPTWGADQSLILESESAFPFFGKQFTKSGIVLPQPHGFSVNLFYVKQKLLVENLALGFNGAEPTDLGGMIQVDDYQEDAQTVNFRLDTWVLPFLNVYALAGLSNIESEIDLGSNLDLEMDLTNSGTFAGYGAMLASVFGPVYVSAEANATYLFSDASSKADQVYTSSFRIGPVFKFKEHPKRNLIVWVGGLNTNLHGTSKGDYELIDLFPKGQEDINRTLTNLDTWYGSLSLSDQEMYADGYQTVKGGLESVSAGIEDGEVAYKMDKELDMPWNLLIGAQLQLGSKFHIKGEAQILGDRNAGVLSINYRFGSALSE